MDKERILLKDIVRVEPFKTPEGYFENFTNGIMSKLPEVVREESKSVSLWLRVRPWIYMAAMIAGVVVMMRVFTGSPMQPNKIKNYASEGFNLTSSSDIDDFYGYYEDGLAQLAYDDAFYLTNNTEENNSK